MPAHHCTLCASQRVHKTFSLLAAAAHCRGRGQHTVGVGGSSRCSANPVCSLICGPVCSASHGGTKLSGALDVQLSSSCCQHKTCHAGRCPSAACYKAAERMAHIARSGTGTPSTPTPSTPTPGLLDLPGDLMCLIWQQLGVADRKSLCCTAHSLRACEGGRTLQLVAFLHACCHALYSPACRDQCAADRLRGGAAA